ncbi:uncharacterized protein LOC113312943 [Papaver somniferum]|uniref:uncharacterized protein LOC113312943 n=1 Tax=Papaver somniferum TaxID=3469 RepID=UPI000E6F5E62|nr:uncharacterized protein LOC113312943 [Papaver somniferum]
MGSSSPYLYITCAEALSSYIDNLQRNGTLRGIKICKNAPEMTHLLFADDSLLFTTATIKNFTAIKNYLQKYRLASGQEINFDKSGILFSRRIPEHRKDARTTLVKHSGKAIPLFQMGAFLIPQHLCRQMDAHLCKFWRGETLDPKDRKLHLLGWDILCSPKYEGGLGFRKAEINNLAMLVRNVWNIIENPDCMLAKILKARYFPRTDILNAKCPDKCSWTWKCLHAIKELIKPFISWIFLHKHLFLFSKKISSVAHVLASDQNSRLPDDSQSLFVAIMWSLWTSRNNLVFQNVSENHTSVLERAKAMLLTRKTTTIATLTTPISLSHKWMPPLFGWIKCNTDGAFDDITGYNGAGYVMRNFTSKASFCAAMVFEVSSAEEVEARAIWGVLKKAVDQKMTHLIIESDAKKLVEQFSSGSFDGDPRTYAIFKDIKLFSSKLSACIFSFQHRICNSVAHELAQWEKHKKASTYWFVPPAWLAPTVEGDY